MCAQEALKISIEQIIGEKDGTIREKDEAIREKFTNGFKSFSPSFSPMIVRSIGSVGTCSTLSVPLGMLF